MNTHHSCKFALFAGAFRFGFFRAFGVFRGSPLVLRNRSEAHGWPAGAVIGAPGRGDVNRLALGETARTLGRLTKERWQSGLMRRS